MKTYHFRKVASPPSDEGLPASRSACAPWPLRPSLAPLAAPAPARAGRPCRPRDPSFLQASAPAAIRRLQMLFSSGLLPGFPQRFLPHSMPSGFRSEGGSELNTVLSLLVTFTHWRRQWQPTPVFLPGGSQGRGSLVGCRLWGRTAVGQTAAATWRQQPACVSFEHL